MNSQATQEEINLTDAVVRTLAYADIFNYPLTAREIHRYLIGVKTSRAGLTDWLQENRAGAPIEQSGDFYNLPGRGHIVPLRAQHENFSRHLWPHAIYFGCLIARLPYVRMVAVTGSLAMNNADERGDIDYLIVTANDRLWLCRLLVLILVRLAARRGIHLCPNYFISERTLTFSERSLYAAHEFVQMIPVAGQAVFQKMQSMNQWVYDHLPNVEGLPVNAPQLIQADSAPKLKTWLERILITPPFDLIERWEMNRKIRKLSRPSDQLSETQFTADVCKGHFDNHGQRTQRHHAERLQHFLTMEIKS